MGRYAIIDENNKVTNVAEWDGITEWKPPEKHIVKQHEFVSIEDIWMDEIEDFVRPLSILYSKQKEDMNNTIT